MRWDYRAFIERCETPSFVYDIDMLTDRLVRMRALLGDDRRICFAMKANPLLADIAAPHVDRIEVCSPGEFEICMQYGIPVGKVFYTGVNKTEKDIRRAIEAGVRLFNAESMTQLEMLRASADVYGVRLDVLPRLSAGDQFGIDRALMRAVLTENRYSPTLNIIGLHYFAGTARDKKRAHDVASLREFISSVKFFAGGQHEIEYGPGLGAAYFEGEHDDMDGALSALTSLFNDMPDGYGLTFEMGRYITAPCGVYATAIVDTKENGGVRYAIADGGCNHLNYYGQMMGMRVPYIIHVRTRANSQNEEPQEWCICGSLCSTADVLVRRAFFQGLRTGDLLFFENAGAYAGTEAMYMFLSRDMPAVYLYDDANGFVLARPGMTTFDLNMRRN